MFGTTVGPSAHSPSLLASARLAAGSPVSPVSWARPPSPVSRSSPSLLLYATAIPRPPASQRAKWHPQIRHSIRRTPSRTAQAVRQCLSSCRLDFKSSGGFWSKGTLAAADTAEARRADLHEHSSPPPSHWHILANWTTSTRSERAWKWRLDWNERRPRSRRTQFRVPAMPRTASISHPNSRSRITAVERTAPFRLSPIRPPHIHILARSLPHPNCRQTQMYGRTDEASLIMGINELVASIKKMPGLTLITPGNMTTIQAYVDCYPAAG
ncbi:hypothetical protein DFP72DRAFT_151994 [Ephemerocybe angulata]|uniref:Uncharacterized protein n=1 Tax=Ephemerocybe angulata TaxID=980116 RepID=A0A8H6H9Q0_9AGAR|nr:hypothetical protein DFP72DRAFT_151994 [Tulosesus angulatus]